MCLGFRVRGSFEVCGVFCLAAVVEVILFNTPHVLVIIKICVARYLLLDVVVGNV
jgi:hypothetical protein